MTRHNPQQSYECARFQDPDTKVWWRIVRVGGTDVYCLELRSSKDSEIGSWQYACDVGTVLTIKEPISELRVAALIRCYLDDLDTESGYTARPAKKRQPIPIADIPPKTDGLGNPLVDLAMYYVQDSRQRVGNCILWWGINGAGYTCDLDAAGTYTGARCAGMRGTDVPWPVEHVRANTITHVRGDISAFDRSNYQPGPRS